MSVDIPLLKLNNGVEIPQLGLGVYKAEEGEEVEQAVRTALDAGYRLIDTAAVYQNETGVGKAIAESGVPRDEIFVTTKLWNSDQGYESTLAAMEASLQRLGMEYVDLYLIHWPAPSLGLAKDTWRAFEKLYENGKSRAIGVSNFQPQHLEDLLSDAKVVPALNQIELHPMMAQHETRQYCQEKGIIIESWSPIMRGGELLEHPLIKDLCDKYEKEPAQIVLRWHIQSGFVVIPKSVTPSRIQSNIDIFNFELAEDEMKQIDSLDAGRRIGPDPNTM